MRSLAETWSCGGRTSKPDIDKTNELIGDIVYYPVQLPMFKLSSWVLDITLRGERPYSKISFVDI